MKTSRSQIADIVATRTLSSSPQVSRISRSVAAYLLENGRTGELESLMRDVIEVRSEQGVVEVAAVSANKLSSDVVRDIRREIKKRYPNAKKILLNEQLDPSVVAGVRLELPGEQLDLSVRAQLNRFKQLTSVGE
jgi:F0F1-type ATP synthase delta subunit